MLKSGKAANKMDTKQDETKLLNIFPAEIWTMLGEISDTNTFYNLIHSSPYFHKLLYSHREQLLFPKVWQHLDRIFCKREIGDSEEQQEDNGVEGQDGVPVEDFGRVDNGMEVENDIEKLFPYSTTLRKLRLVCKTWCKAIDKASNSVDHHFHSGNFHTEQLFEKNFVYSVDAVDTRINPGHYEFDVKFALEHFQNSHGKENCKRNPFFDGALALAVKNDPVYSAAMSEFLEKYGGHVHFLWVTWYSHDNSLVQLYTNLRAILEFTPNIVSLVVSTEIEQRHQNWTDTETVKILMASTPMATLDKLELLEFEESPAEILGEILQRSRNLKRLQVEKISNGHLPQICKRELPNLQQFYAPHRKNLVLENLNWSSVTWPLTKLCLEAPKVDDVRGFVGWSVVFTLLEKKWGNTLTELSINLPHAKTFDDREVVLKDSLTLRLNLPRLKALRLGLGNLAVLDFLLPMKDSLIFFELEFKCANGRDGQINSVCYATVHQVIRFAPLLTGGCGEGNFKGGECDCILYSNIWDLFPKLERAVYNDKSFKKSQRDKLQKSKQL